MCAYYELGAPEQKNAFELSHVVSATVKRYEEKPGLKNRLMSVGAEVSRHTHARLDIYLHF